jgi:hypothetical protein
MKEFVSLLLLYAFSIFACRFLCSFRSRNYYYPCLCSLVLIMTVSYRKGKDKGTAVSSKFISCITLQFELTT